jgi:RNase P subunit RPR2
MTQRFPKDGSGRLVCVKCKDLMTPRLEAAMVFGGRPDVLLWTCSCGHHATTATADAEQVRADRAKAP